MSSNHESAPGNGSFQKLRDEALEELIISLQEVLEERDRRAVREGQMAFDIPTRPYAVPHPSDAADDRPEDDRVEPEGVPSDIPLPDALTVADHTHSDGDKDPPQSLPPPPDLRWLIWKAAWLPAKMLRAVTSDRSSGGEAGGQVKVRRLVVESWITLMVVVFAAGSLNWAGQLFFDTGSLVDSVREWCGGVAERVLDGWRALPTSRQAAGISVALSVLSAPFLRRLVARLVARRMARLPRKSSPQRCTCGVSDEHVPRVAPRRPTEP